MGSNFEKKISDFEAFRKDTGTRLSELSNKNDQLTKDVVGVSEIKSKFDSKVNIWDSKADPQEVKKIDTFVNEEVKKMKKDIEYMLEKNDEMNRKNTSNENQETISKNLENKLNGNIAQIENKMAIIEASRQDTTT